MLQLKDYNLSKETLERKVSQQDAVLKTMTESVRQLEKKSNLFENEKRLLEKADEVLLKKREKQTTVVGSSSESW